MQISTNLHVKAQRLVDEDRVEHVKGSMYRVVGDHATYTVHLSYPQEATGACDCLGYLYESGGICSHLLAASILYLLDPPLVSAPTTDPFEGLN